MYAEKLIGNVVYAVDRNYPKAARVGLGIGIVATAFYEIYKGFHGDISVPTFSAITGVDAFGAVVLGVSNRNSQTTVADTVMPLDNRGVLGYNNDDRAS